MPDPFAPFVVAPPDGTSDPFAAFVVPPPPAAPTGWRHAGDVAISDLTALPRLAFSLATDPSGTARGVGQSLADLYQKANAFVADPITSLKGGLTAVTEDPWGAAGHVGAFAAQGGAMAGLKRLGGALAPAAEELIGGVPVSELRKAGVEEAALNVMRRGRSAMPAAPPTSLPTLRRIEPTPPAPPPPPPPKQLGTGAIPLPPSTGPDPSFVRGVPATLAEREPPVAPVNPAEALAKLPGFMSDQQVAEALNARFAKGELKTPSAGLAQQMTQGLPLGGEEGRTYLGPLLRAAGVPGRILAYPMAYHYAGGAGVATLGAADLAKLLLEHPELASQIGRGTLLANMSAGAVETGK